MNIFTISLEFFLFIFQMIDLGFVLHPGAYLRDFWNFMDITVVLNLGTITKRILVKLKTASFGTTWIDMSLMVVHLSFCPFNIRIRR